MFQFAKRPSTVRAICIIALVLATFVQVVFPQAPDSGKALYDQIKAFDLNGGKVDVSNLTIKRDRAVMTFTGTFFLSAPTNGKVTGAVFVGTGTFKADPPANDFERANLRRLIKADSLVGDFTTAALRFTDDTAALIGTPSSGAATPQAIKAAAEVYAAALKETGANIPARILVSLLNQEKLGFFFASFDGGKSGKLRFVLDHQNRIPTSSFDINGGEKGLIYSYKPSNFGTEVLMAFYAEQDYARNQVDYSDASDIVDIEHYDMDIDLRSPKDRLAVRTTIKMRALVDGVKVIPLSIGESLSEFENERLKRQMRVRGAYMSKKQLAAPQEDWEGGFSVVLPEAVAKGQPIELEVELEGDFLRDAQFVANCWYPISNTSWYPRHGYLDRSTYSMNFQHEKKLKIATIGSRLSEDVWPEDKNVVITKYKMSEPVSLVTFALGPWERHVQQTKFENTERVIPLEFNSVSGAALPIKESFIIAELDNSIRYFSAIFGAYPYQSYSATFHPYGFGQGFPSMLVIPPADRTSKHTFAFISHETAHQWWGNIVAWRSYRDQWLSEGFAEYSGALYTALRDSKAAGRELIEEMRDSLRMPPRTLTGTASGRLNDVGPIILGHRVSSSRTVGAYQALIYSKGALVLRMLHFLFSNPANGDDKLFLAMMKDFVEKHRNSTASSDDFRFVANEHFPNTPIAKKYGLKDLNWFFGQWVYGTEMPSYQVEYSIQNNTDGSFLVSGEVNQQNVGEGWFMPIPVVLYYDNGTAGSGTIHAYGPKTPFQIKLPQKPSKIEIDPAKWILTDKVAVKQRSS